MKKKTRCLFIGRFQPVHKGHHAVIKQLLHAYDEVIIVIGSAEKCDARENPFSAGERVEMLRACFGRFELSRLVVLPVRDINNNSLWVPHITSYVPSFSVMYTNNALVKALFERAGKAVRPVEYVQRSIYEGRIIRRMMAEGDGWEARVPEQAAAFLKSIGAEKRMKQIMKPPEEPLSR